VALAILALLSLFAITLVRITTLERQASANYTAQVEARLAAEAGVSRAVAAAKAGIANRHWAEPGDWWLLGSPPAAPVTIKVQDNEIFSRAQVQSFDLSARFNVNTRSPNAESAMQIIFMDEGGMGAGAAASAVSKIMAARIARDGIRSHRGLEQVLGTADYVLVRDFLTTHGLSEAMPSATDPTSLSTRGGASGNLPVDYDGAILPMSTSLVNINTASPTVIKAVLAELSGRSINLGSAGSGEWLTGALAGNRATADNSGGGATISSALAEDLAAEIDKCRRGVAPYTGSGAPAPPSGPFKSWNDFDRFLDYVSTSVGGVSLSQVQRALIMSICGTDGRNMGYNPDRSRRGGAVHELVDKSCVDDWAAGFSLGPSGLLEIRAQGWVEAVDDATATPPTFKLLAREFVERVVRVFTPYRFESQRALEAAWGNAGAVSDSSSMSKTYQSMPELTDPAAPSARADPTSGFIRLTSEDVATSGDVAASVLNDPADPPTPLSFAGGGTPPLRNQGPFGPDGAVVWRSAWGPSGWHVNGGAPAPANAAWGSYEFWIKYANADEGTDELLFNLTIDDSSVAGAGTPLAATIEGAVNAYTAPATVGATVKLERFKDKLRATWFYWGEGTGGLSRFVCVLTEVQADISGWESGDWHHVAVSWLNTEQNWTDVANGTPIESGSVPGDGIQIYIDGALAAPSDKFSYSAIEQGDEWVTLGDFKDIDGDGTLDEVTKRNVVIHLGQIASVPRAQGVCVGGYQATGGGEDIHETGVLAGSVHRYPNATVDDPQVYSGSNVGSAGSAPLRGPSDRIVRNGGGTVPDDMCTFSLPVPAGTTGVLVTVDFLSPDPACKVFVGGNNAANEVYPAPLSDPVARVRVPRADGRQESAWAWSETGSPRPRSRA
jgi:hypothetical protein